MLIGMPTGAAFLPFCPICLGPGNSSDHHGGLDSHRYHLYFSPLVMKQYIQLKEERSHVEGRGQLNIIRALRNEGHRVKTIAY